MTEPKLIRIERVRFDYLTARLEGVAIRRKSDGQVVRSPLSIPGDAFWSHGQALRALQAASE